MAGSPAASRAVLLWGALAFALSPSLVELFHHWTDEPWARGSAIFFPLAMAAMVADPSCAPPRGRGWLLVAGGLLLSTGAFAAGVMRLGRPGIPLAALGMAQAIGRPSLRVAAIWAFALPIPFAATRVFSPELESAVARIAAAVAGQLGGEWAALAGRVQTPHGVIQLQGPDLGVPLAHLLAGLGYCAAIGAGAPGRRGAARALRWAVWALPVQALALTLGFAGLPLLGADAARAFLDVAPVGAVAAIGVARLAGRPQPAARPLRLVAAPVGPGRP